MCHSRVYFKSIRKGTFHPGDVHRTQRGEAACDAFQLDANKAAVRAIMSDVFRTRHASLSKTGWRFPCCLYCKNLEHFRIQYIFTTFLREIIAAAVLIYFSVLKAAGSDIEGCFVNYGFVCFYLAVFPLFYESLKS